jgi:hypothetical protein
MTTIVLTYTEGTKANLELCKSFLKFYGLEVIEQEVTAEKNVAICRNEALQKCTTETIVFMPLNCLIYNAQLTISTLLFYYKNYPEIVGSIGILKQGQQYFYSSLKNLSDEIMEVNFSANPEAYPIYMANAQMINELGGFETSKELAPHIDQLLQRKMQVMGYFNFYIPYKYAYAYKFANSELMPRVTQDSLKAFELLSKEYAKGNPIETEDINDIM